MRPEYPAVPKQSSTSIITTALDPDSIPVWRRVIDSLPKPKRIRQYPKKPGRYTRAQLEEASRKLREEGVPSEWWLRRPTTGGLASAARIPRSEYVRGGAASEFITHPIPRRRHPEGVYVAAEKLSAVADTLLTIHYRQAS